MLLQIGVRVPDVHDPLGLLAASLRRHLSRLRALTFASAHLLDVDEESRLQASEGLREALAFFDRASDDPFRDEAEILFPWLLEKAPGDRELERHCAALGADRAEAAKLHRDASEHGGALAAGELTTTRLRKLADAADGLEELYRAHLERLEAAIFPRVSGLLQESDRGLLGEQMLRATRATVAPDDARVEPMANGLP